MRTISLFAVLLLLHAPFASAQSATAKPARPSAASEEGGESNKAVLSHLVGRWRATPERISLSSDFDVSVWGKNATSVREVTLNVQPSGHGKLTVIRKVVDAKGRAVPGSTSIEEADFAIGAAREPVASRTEYETTVSKAERLYPDMPNSDWSLTGLRVTLATFAGEEGKSLEVRFDTPEGRGSFWETLRRVTAAK